MTPAERITRANDILMRGAYRRYLREQRLEAGEAARASDARPTDQGQPNTHGSTQPDEPMRNREVLP